MFFSLPYYKSKIHLLVFGNNKTDENAAILQLPRAQHLVSCWGHSPQVLGIWGVSGFTLRK